MINKKLFKDTIKFILKKQKQQNKFCDMLEEMSPGCRCDAIIYSDYETKIVELLQAALNDESDLLGYYLYEFINFTEEQQKQQIKLTPVLESLDTLYDYLASKEVQNE